MDRISKLPEGIIETVLCFLPLQEAARTSILSKEWRHRWNKIPKLEFTKQKFKVWSGASEMPERSKYFSVIFQILLIHEGPILEFTFSMQVDPSLVEIDPIILHLSKKNTVKILKLNLVGGYRLPLSFFALDQLTDLYLNECVISHQPLSSRFGSLTTLHLKEIETSEKMLLRLLSSCPSLKRLTLDCDSGTISDRGESNIADLFQCVPVIEYLFVAFFIFMCFSPNKLPKELPTILVHLKYLSMDWVWFRHKYAVPFFALLIRSCPNLEKLKLQICIDDDLYDESQTSSFKRKDYSDVTLEHLNTLEIINFGDDENELRVVKLILARSPVLRNVKILLWDGFDEDEKLEISESILSFRCASPMAKIIIS